MSWKSIVIAGLLCVLAAPVWAVPSLSVSNGGLDASGNWIWNVAITPTGGSSLDAELGFRETFAGQQLLSASIADAGVWDTDNPGTQIFDWETADGEGDYVGLQMNAATDEIFSAIGSAIAADATATQYLTITTAGPTDVQLTSSLETLGAYGGNGVIAEFGNTYDNFAGTATRTVVLGDVNLSGGSQPVSGADLGILAQNFGKSFATTGDLYWTDGDLNGTDSGSSQVTGADLGLLAQCFGKTGAGGACGSVTSIDTPLNVDGVLAAGAGAGGAAVAAPEPSSLALLGLAVLGGLGLFRRK